MNLFARNEPLERVREIAGEGSAPAADRAYLRASPIEAAPDVRATAPAREDVGARTALVMAISIGAHALFAGVLAMLPAASSMLSAPAPMVEIEMALAEPVVVPPPPEPAIVPEPPPEPEPIARAPRPRAVAEPEPEVTPQPEPPAPAPAAIAPSAPPSLDDVFGEPAPAPSAMTAEGGGAPFAAGSPDGRAGGVGSGTGTGGGGGGGAVPSGPSADEIRRARRSYAGAIHQLLSENARYPVAARAQRLSGRVELALRIAEDGRLIAVRVVGSSGYALLDDAAVATAQGLGSFPRPPAIVPWSPREEVRTSLVYSLTR